MGTRVAGRRERPASVPFLTGWVLLFIRTAGMSICNESLGLGESFEGVNHSPPDDNQDERANHSPNDGDRDQGGHGIFDVVCRFSTETRESTVTGRQKEAAASRPSGGGAGGGQSLLSPGLFRKDWISMLPVAAGPADRMLSRLACSLCSMLSLNVLPWR